MGKECGVWVSRRLWGGGKTRPLKTTAWEARVIEEGRNPSPNREEETTKKILV